MAAQLLRFFLIPAFVVVWSAVIADEPAPLPKDELQQITLSLLERYPELAASPGVKIAQAAEGGPGTIIGTAVIYYPHREDHGIKEAFEAHCTRAYPNKTWTCDDVVIRRYLQLASQDFEVRVTGDISSEAALALIEATRRDMQASVTDGAVLPDTAIIVQAHEDGDQYVAWGAPDGLWNLKMRARLIEGGDPTNPDDWHASVFKPPTGDTYISL